MIGFDDLVAEAEAHGYPLDDEAETDFWTHVKGVNVMAAHSITYAHCGNYAVELAWGEGFAGEIFGVTCVDLEQGKIDSSMSDHFTSIRNALAYMDSVG